MKIYIIAMSLLTGIQTIQAQSIQRSVIGSAGKVTTAGAYKLSYTVGEAITKKVSASGLIINQGFQQNRNALNVVLPITGLEFYAKRLNNNTVQLDWKTVQEINNKGFHIERKKENENSFADVGFVASHAGNGNSSSPLNYTKTDGNNFAGNTYYRLRQEDIDGKTTYSVVRIIKSFASKQLAIQVWPIPSTGPVNILVSGLTKPDVLMVFDIAGKLVKQQAVQNNAQVQLNNLVSGTYILKLAENKDLVQKIVVQ